MSVTILEMKFLATSEEEVDWMRSLQENMLTEKRRGLDIEPRDAGGEVEEESPLQSWL